MSNPSYADMMAKSGQKVEGGDFPRTIDWNDEPNFIGVYNGFIVRNVKGDDRVIQTFTTEDGEAVEAWGTAILDSRLKQVPEGFLVQVTYLGKNAPTKRGVLAHNFEVLWADPAELAFDEQEEAF